MNWQKLSQKTLALLRVRPVIGGLEIGDLNLRYAAFDGTHWQTASLRLPPGIISMGRIQNRPQFVQAVRALHSQVEGDGKRKQLDVVVGLSSVNIYSQVFSLPMIEGENLEKAVQLNIQMASPEEVSKTYSGWQMVGQDQGAVRLEILSAFINREVVDELVAALKEANFLVHSVEPRATSLTRTIRDLAVGFDRSKTYLALSVDSSGMEFLVLRQGELYFQYFTSWQDLYGGEKQISEEAFRSAVVRSLHQVMNFYNSHWSEPIAGIYVAATGLRDKIVSILNENFSLNMLDLKLNLPQEVSPDWFVAFGTGLRGLTPRREDKEISLLGVSAREEFWRAQTMRFLRFWEILVPASLSVLFLSFVGADLALVSMQQSLKQNSVLQIGEAQFKEIEKLKQEVTDFNRAVNLVGKVSAVMQPKFELLEEVQEIAVGKNVNLVRFYYQDSTGQALLSGETSSEERIQQFTNSMKSEPRFQSVNLPLSDVKPTGGGLSFSMSFTISPKAD